MEQQSHQSVESKLDDLASKAKVVGEEKTFMEPGTTRKRGRPAGSKNKGQGTDGSHGLSGGKPSAPGGEGAPQRDPIAELMPITMGLATFYSNFLVQVAEDEKARPDKEKEKIIAQMSAVCLNQYFPNAFGVHAAAITLCVVVAETSFNAFMLRRENLAKLIAEKKMKQNTNGHAGPARPTVETPFQQ